MHFACITLIKFRNAKFQKWIMNGKAPDSKSIVFYGKRETVARGSLIKAAEKFVFASK